MERTHITSERITTLRDVNPMQGAVGDLVGAFKPYGFWYEVDGDWRRWMESETPRWLEHSPLFLYSVDLGEARILALRTLSAFDRFQAKYRRPYVPSLPALKMPVIAWDRVAADGWDGVEIAPYLYERRFGLDTLWYYSWDCASGVVWNASKLKLTYLSQIS